MLSLKKSMLFLLLVTIGFPKAGFTDEKDTNELSMSIGFVSAGFSFKKRISSNFFVGPAIGFGSSRSLSRISSDKIGQGGIQDEMWLELVGSFKASKMININTGISYSNYARVLDEFVASNDFGSSTGFFIQPEIGSDNIKIGTKIALKKFHENDYDNGMGIQWTPLILRVGLKW